MHGQVQRESQTQESERCSIDDKGSFYFTLELISSHDTYRRRVDHYFPVQSVPRSQFETEQSPLALNRRQFHVSYVKIDWVGFAEKMDCSIDRYLDPPPNMNGWLSSLPFPEL